MVIYADVDKCRLGFCPGLKLHLFRIASGGFICVPFCTLFFWQSVQLVQLVPVYCPCGLVIDVLRLPVCVYVLFMPKSVIIAFCARSEWLYCFLPVCCLAIYKAFSAQLIQVLTNATDIYNKCKNEIQTGENAERKDKIKIQGVEKRMPVFPSHF